MFLEVDQIKLYHIYSTHYPDSYGETIDEVFIPLEITPDYVSGLVNQFYNDFDVNYESKYSYGIKLQDKGKIYYMEQDVEHPEQYIKFIFEKLYESR